MSKKYRSQSDKADLIFPVGRISTMLRKTVKVKWISVQAALHLTAVLEYIIAEILDVSIAHIVKLNKKRIKPKYIVEAIKKDGSLSELLSDRWIVILDKNNEP